MPILSLWIAGTTRTGKTLRLVSEFRNWVRKQLIARRSKSSFANNLASTALVFAANNHNRRELNDRLSLSVEGTYPVLCKTPLGFIADEVELFFPLLFEQLQLKAQFPLRLRPETEQELATKLWRKQPDWETLCESEREYRLVRQTLDLLQLAGASGIPTEDINLILQQGYSAREINTNKVQLWQRMGELLLVWRDWCLERALLSYGLIYELYWRYLLPNPQYQYHLSRRYQMVFADDTDDYPAIARDLFELMLDRGANGIFTYNPDGKIRLGLNADPEYVKDLAARCRRETLSFSNNSLAIDAATAVELVTEEAYLVPLPETIQSLQTVSRAELLNQTAEIIVRAVEQGLVRPEEIAIIAPGLDEIARYTLIKTLEERGVAIAPLNEQRPLVSSPVVRALLTLLALCYPDLGRMVDRNAIAEMLTVLSQKTQEDRLVPDIDPVRAGLIADYCYCADPHQPHLASVESFSRWDRLGHQATTAYQKISEWIASTQTQVIEQTFLTPTILLDRAIATFFDGGSYLKRDRLAVLRELIETAQHFWEVDRRLRQNEPSFQTQTATVAQFIQLLRRGTITANPLPLRQFQTQTNAVTLATVFQYRSLRTAHRWQFWLDAGSPLWQQGGAATLFGAPLFLRNWSGRTWMPEDDYELDKQRLQRIIRDVLGRATEKVFLCHSDLGVNGTEQMGALLPLVHSAKPFVEEKINI